MNHSNIGWITFYPIMLWKKKKDKSGRITRKLLRFLFQISLYLPHFYKTHQFYLMHKDCDHQKEIQTLPRKINKNPSNKIALT
jgi:hypothetical protein